VQTITSSPTWTPTPYVSVVTVTGQARTVTITPTGPPSAQQTTTNITSTAKDTLGAGAIAGISIGVVSSIFLAVAVVWMCYRRKQQKEGQWGIDGRDSITNSLSPNRQSGIPEITTTYFDELHRHHPDGTDSRLNQFILGQHPEGRISNSSLLDSRDYSRPVLRVS